MSIKSSPHVQTRKRRSLLNAHDLSPQWNRDNPPSNFVSKSTASSQDFRQHNDCRQSIRKRSRASRSRSPMRARSLSRSISPSPDNGKVDDTAYRKKDIPRPPAQPPPSLPGENASNAFQRLDEDMDIDSEGSKSKETIRSCKLPLYSLPADPFLPTKHITVGEAVAEWEYIENFSSVMERRFEATSRYTAALKKAYTVEFTASDLILRATCLERRAAKLIDEISAQAKSLGDEILMPRLSK